MEKSQLAIIAVGIIAVLLIAGGTLSIVSPPTTVSLEGGKVYWHATASASFPSGEAFNFYYKVGENVNNYPLADGTQIQPKSSFAVTLAPMAPTCSYSFMKKSATFGIIFPAPNNDVAWDYYELYPAATRHLWMTLSTSKNANQFISLDGAIPNQEKILTDFDGRGSVKVDTLGAFMTDSDCPPGNDVMLVKGQSGMYVCKFYVGIGYKCEPNTAFLSYFPDVNGALNAVFNQGATQFTVARPINKVGVAVVSFTADADMFDSVTYTPPTAGKPELVCGSVGSVNEGSQGSVALGVKNVGSSTGSFLVTFPSSSLISPGASFTTPSVLPGNQYSWNQLFSSALVGSDSSGSFGVKACAITGQFGGVGDCATCTVNALVKNTGDNVIPPTPTPSVTLLPVPPVVGGGFNLWLIVIVGLVAVAGWLMFKKKR